MRTEWRRAGWLPAVLLSFWPAGGRVAGAVELPAGGTVVSAAIEPARAEALARRRLMAQHEAAFGLFKQESDEFRRDVNSLIERRMRLEKDRVTAALEPQLRQLEGKERTERRDAIARFEAFLQVHPDDARYTPDAMARLAELYYEKSIDDQSMLLAENELRAREGVEEGQVDTSISFDRSIALYREIIERFPGYALLDTVHYLLGYCLSSGGDTEGSRQAFVQLLERFPQSRHAAEAWVRLGEYHFDNIDGDPRENLKLAIEAYRKALQIKDSPLYDKALYKMGWAYYRMDAFAEAVEAFFDLIDLYEQRKAAGDDTGGDLRAEAIQYAAISFADDKWAGVEVLGEGKERFLGVQKLTETLARRGERPYAYELYRRLGDVLYDATRFEAAVESYKLVLAADPNNPQAPQVQDKIIQACAKAGNVEQMFRERELLAQNYGDGSEWAVANRMDHEVLKAARDLVERSLFQTAFYYHQKGDQWVKVAEDPAASPDKREAAPAQAVAAYRAASDKYGEYLASFPHVKNAYDIRQMYASTLYGAERFAEAAEQFEQVRDSLVDNRFQADASFNAVISYRKAIALREKDGSLEARAGCTPETCRRPEDRQPQPIPEIRQRFVAAIDKLLKVSPETEDTPKFLFNAAQTFHVYNHFDVSRPRYEELIGRFPGREETSFAFDDILNSWLIFNDWTHVEMHADRMLRESPKLKSDAVTFQLIRNVKYNARFARANESMQAQKWNDAATLFVSAVDETEKEKSRFGEWVNADKALYNAARSYTEFRKFESAMRTYERLYRNYPASAFAEEAVYLVAENAEKAFENEKAVESYLLLYRNYPQSKFRMGALFNAAHLLEAMQRYDDAAENYRLYAATYPNESDAPDMAYQSAVIYKRKKDYPSYIAGLEAFIRQFDRRPEQAARIVIAYRDMAQAYTEMGSAGSARLAYGSAVSEFDRRQIPLTNLLAANAAAESAFMLAEPLWAEFQSLKLEQKGRGEKAQELLAASLDRIRAKAVEVKSAYAAIIERYKTKEWGVAALFRAANVPEEFSNKWLAAPCPEDTREAAGEEGCDAYRVLLEEQAAPFLEDAVNSYEQGQARAIEWRISNKWTKLVAEKVCLLSPGKCLSLKEPRSLVMIDEVSASPLVRDAKGEKQVVYASQALASSSPVVREFEPRKVGVGDRVVVRGQNFGTDASLLEARVGNRPVAIQSLADGELSFTVPEGCEGGVVTVKGPTGSGGSAYPLEVGLPTAPAAIGAPGRARSGQAPGSDGGRDAQAVPDAGSDTQPTDTARPADEASAATGDAL